MSSLMSYSSFCENIRNIFLCHAEIVITLNDKLQCHIKQYVSFMLTIQTNVRKHL